jgi:hypothetical protein
MAIVRSRGFVQLRRGLFEHVQNGEMLISFFAPRCQIRILSTSLSEISSSRRS